MFARLYTPIWSRPLHFYFSLSIFNVFICLHDKFSPVQLLILQMLIFFRQKVMFITRGGHIRNLLSSSNEHNLTRSITTEKFGILHELVLVSLPLQKFPQPSF